MRNIKDKMKEAKRVLRSIEKNFTDQGLMLSFIESYISGPFFCYQRNYFLNGRVCENAIKATRKASAGGSDSSCGIMHIVQTAMNAGVTISSKSPDPYLRILFAYTEAITHLMLRPDLAEFFPKHDTLAALIPLMNAGLGGLGFFQFPSFLYSGHQDPETECLAMLMKLWNIRPDLRRNIASLIHFERGEINERAQTQLIINPSALNIRGPPSVESKVREMVEDFLRNSSKIRNVAFNERMDLVDESAVNDIC